MSVDKAYDITQDLIQYLLSLDIDYFCISPGSRSTPLTLTLAKYQNAKKAIFYDERAAAYHAVGYARATGKPAVLICTSGTAPANYFPAVMEANNDRLPLIVISADRPFELYDTGANQTVNQQNLYGTNVGGFANIEANGTMAGKDLIQAKEIVQLSVKQNKPVQINVMYKKPLEPSEDYNFSKIFEQNISETTRNTKDIDIKTEFIIIGELNYLESCKMRELLVNTKIPFWADIRSGLRNLNVANNISNFEDIVENSPDRTPTNIAHIGGKLVSKKITDYLLNSHKTILTAFTFREQKAETFCKARYVYNISILDNIKIFNMSYKDILFMQYISIPANSGYTDYNICKYIYNNAPNNACIFSGNSMSVRNFDAYSGKESKALYFAANRGVSGIDGNIASAVGMAAGLKGIAKKLICVIGDITAIHDLNSLSTLQYAGMPVTIIILNNHGGSIFSKLPIRKYKEEFDYWKTPHNLNFKGAAEMFGLDYYIVSDFSSFKESFMEDSCKHRLIEVEI